MKKILSVLLLLALLLSISAAQAVNEDVEGELVIYSSAYPEVLDMLDEALKKEFPNLTPGVNGSFFFYSGSGKLISRISGEMGPDRDQPLECDMLMMAEPSYSLEMKDYGYLHPFEIENADTLFRFPYDPEGYWYPVRVCNMVLAYNPEAADYWAGKGVNIPKTFRDFASDPTLKGYISMGDPMTSGTAYAAVVGLTEKYGDEYLDWLAANEVMRESGSTAIAKLQDNQCAALMILEESILKFLYDENETNHKDIRNVEVIYPEDGVVLIPSNVMIVAEEYSKNANIDAAEAVARWFATEDGQEAILRGFMHSTLAAVKDHPYHSIDTDDLIKRDIGVDWIKAYKERDDILSKWTEKVTTAR